MANRDRINERLGELILDLARTEAMIEDKDTVLKAQDGMRNSRTYESLHRIYTDFIDFLTPYIYGVGHKYGEVLALYFTPTAFTILAENITVADLQAVDAGDEFIKAFTEDQTTHGRESLLELLEPGKTLDLYRVAEKHEEIEAQLQANREDEKISVTLNLSIPKPKIQKRITTATPESLRGIGGLLRVDNSLIEQSIRREVKATNKDNNGVTLIISGFDKDEAESWSQ